MQKNFRFAVIVLACAGLVALVWVLLHGGDKPLDGDDRTGPAPAETANRGPAEPAPPPRAPRNGRVDSGALGGRTAVTGAPRGGETVNPGVILGRIRSHDGQPAANATVAILQTAGEDPIVAPKSPVRRETQTDADGAFEVTGLPAGAYSLLASMEDYAQLEQADLSVEMPVASFELKLVASGYLAGVVRNSDGLALENVALWALQPQGAGRYGLSRPTTGQREFESRLMLLPQPVTSDDQGAFQFPDLPKAPTYVLAMPVDAAPSLAGPVNLPSDGLTVQVSPGGGFGGRVVLHDSGEPVSGVAVIAGGATAPERHETVASEEGRFGFAALRPGVYEMAVNDERYALQGVAPRVQVREGELDSDVIIRVVPAASVSGRVYNRESEKALGELYVAARGEGRLPVRTVETRSDGSYALPGMSPGRYRVYVAAPSLRYVRASGLGIEASVTLQPGQALEGLDFRVSFGAAVQGYVVDESGSPVSYADVTVTMQEGEQMRTEKTDALGYFTCAGLTPGQRLKVQARKHSLVSAEPAEVVVPPDGTAGDVMLVVSPGATIQGQVVRTSGAPAEAIPVYITAGDAFFLRINDVQPAGSAGTFAWDGLPGGGYTVGVVATGRLEGAADPPKVEVSVTHGEQAAPIRLVWDGTFGEDASLEAGETGNRSIRGRVTDEQGSPIPGADIHARSGTGYAHMSKSLHDGTFEIAGIASGTFSIRAFHRDFAPAEPREVQAGEGNVVLVLQSPAKASGQVIDAATGQPIQKFELAQVSARYLEQESPLASLGWEHIFDPEGRFTMAVGPGRGARVLLAKAEGYAPEQQSIGEVVPGQQITNLMFRLRSGAIVEGLVRDGAGNPVSGASIYLGTQERRGTVLTRSGAQGAFRAEGLEGGAVTLTASHPSYAPATITVSTRLGAVTSSEFVLSVGGTVEGYVRRGGNPLSKQMVSLIVGDRHENAVTDSSGHYAFERLPAGEGTVIVSLRGQSSAGRQYMRSQRSVIVADNSVTRADFEFSSQDARVEGVVTVEGVPAPQASVALTISSGGGEQRTGVNVEANGFYRLENLSPGSAILEVSIRGGRQQRSKTVTFELQAGQRLRQDIDFGPVSAITGTVRGLRAGEQAHVAVLPGEITVEKPTLEDIQAFVSLLSGYTQVASDGTFVVQNIEPGTYTVIGVAISGTPQTELEAFLNARYVTEIIQVEMDKPLEISLNL